MNIDTVLWVLNTLSLQIIVYIIRKTKCSAILERSVHQQKTKRPHKNTNFTASNEE